MCQAFEGEQQYMFARDKRMREQGYDAHTAGAARDSCTEYPHPNPEYCMVRQWQMGWDTAAAGKGKW